MIIKLDRKKFLRTWVRKAESHHLEIGMCPVKTIKKE